MYPKILLLSSVALLLLAGCGSKQYYTPEKTYEASSLSGAEVISFTRDSATLSSGVTLTPTKALTLNLEKGYYFINSSVGGSIVANKKGDCQIIQKNGSSKKIKLPRALVAGTVIDNQLIYLLQNNHFGIYDLAKNSVVYNNKAEKALSIDTRIANPLQVDNLVVIPTLNGKLVILDLATFKISKEIYVSTESTLNNVIFLKRLNNTLVSATPHKVISVSNQGKREFKSAISEVLINDKSIFVFSKDGQISQLDESLKVKNQKKFKFAHFSLATMDNNKIYALDKQGYLIVTNKALTKDKIYSFPEVEDYSFASAGKIYYNGNVIDLSKLNYE